ncbi:hypothetical protein [Algoriphagus boritolerans]|uniref:Uncharacterized protein n=1 Tax=Algoriphagus boritolerans DSM 17298 = JCM 18970 TaxID=1120964 RepID=A0A1H5Z252_9BACT|nr:hypothetical protein [Algoriphagus boritolerans]SEG29456.1 hypothetical protein SAMN03080598_03248 [Algoriphagus boritolerans DSM 17298 = JCM 18970]
MTEKSNELSDKDKVTQASSDEAKGINKEDQVEQKKADAAASDEETEKVESNLHEVEAALASPVEGNPVGEETEAVADPIQETKSEEADSPASISNEETSEIQEVVQSQDEEVPSNDAAQTVPQEAAEVVEAKDHTV